MSLIDFILNVAGILLWLSWRSIPSDPFSGGLPSTLPGTVRRAQPVKIKRWHYLAVLGGLLLARGIFYQQIGPAVNWTPKLDLYFVVLSFHESSFLPALLFSVLSFVRMFLVFHCWLLALAMINRDETGPFQKMIALQLGKLARWPAYAQLTIAVFTLVLLWIVIHPALVFTSVTTRSAGWWPLVGQGSLVALAILISVKYLLVTVLILYLITSYVFLGRSPLWNFASTTASNLLKPLKKLPLRVGRVDLAPLVGIVLILLLLHSLPLYTQYQLRLHDLTLWPQ